MARENRHLARYLSWILLANVTGHLRASEDQSESNSTQTVSVEADDAQKEPTKQQVAVPTAVVVAADSAPFLPDFALPGDSKTWLLLSSGEWLRGDIEVYRRRQLDFDSVRTKQRTYKDKYIREIYSPTAVDVVFDDGTVLVGPMRLNRETITVKTLEDGEVTRPYDDMHTITPHDQGLARWSGHINIGFAVRRDNSKTTDINNDLLLQWRSPYYRVRATYIGAISETNSQETANNHRGTAEFSYFLNRQWYWTPATGSGYNDLFQNLRLQLLAATGFGYIPMLFS